eukprot:COSAG05_NODE_4934_length_1320_cov_1.496314_1_plen_127_part_00
MTARMSAYLYTHPYDDAQCCPECLTVGWNWLELMPADTACIGYTCNVMGFKHSDDDDDHVLWCELRHQQNSRGHDGFHRGRRAYGHVSWFKRYEGDPMNEVLAPVRRGRLLLLPGLPACSLVRASL